MPLRGEMVFQRIFDLGGTLDMAKARQALGALADTSEVQPTRARPEYVSFAAPIALNLAPLGLAITQEDGAAVQASARLYEVGALAVMLRVPIQGEGLGDLARQPQQGAALNGKSCRRADAFQAIADAIRPKVHSALDEIFDQPVDPESYNAFCLTEVPGGAEQVWKWERNRIAALLVGERHPERLATEEVEELLKNWSHYYLDDLIVADWDAAFVIEPAGKYEDLLYVFEVANLELLVLRKYDHYLDQFLERIYGELDQVFRGTPLWNQRAKAMLRELREVRIDLAKVQDELSNTTKFFGDWYLARVYMGLEKKLHVQEYQQAVTEKLTTLRDLYQNVQSEIETRQSMLLEITVVLLIAFEIVMAFWRH